MAEKPKTLVFDSKEDSLRGYETDTKVDSEATRKDLEAREGRAKELRKKPKRTESEQNELSSYEESLSALRSFDLSPNRLFPDQAQRTRDRDNK